MTDNGTDFTVKQLISMLREDIALLSVQVNAHAARDEALAIVIEKRLRSLEDSALLAGRAWTVVRATLYMLPGLVLGIVAFIFRNTGG